MESDSLDSKKDSLNFVLHVLIVFQEMKEDILELGY